MTFPITANDAICAALHVLQLNDQEHDREDFIARLVHEPALAAALSFWRRIETLALTLLAGERPPEYCWTRIEARLGLPH